MKLNQLFDMAWTIAEVEARVLGSEVIEPIHGYLDVLPVKITTIRRRIRYRLARTAKPPIPDKQVIHRSRKTRAAFFDAANQAGGEVIILLQLMESMFDLGFLDVSDMRWRTPTKTFCKGG